jgi:diacylglycerol kinase family enzyme
MASVTAVEGAGLVIQTAALGFPAEIAARYAALRRHSVFRYLAQPAGLYVYRVLAFLGLAAQKRREKRGKNLLRVTCTVAGERLEETVFAIFIGNERSLGGNFHPCPLAVMDDRKMDLCFVRAGTGLSGLALFRAIIRGEAPCTRRQCPVPANAGGPWTYNFPGHALSSQTAISRSRTSAFSWRSCPGVLRW